jgi:hypothetical protein
MGTHVFFEKDETIPTDDLYCKCESYYQFRAKTNKVLKMSRVLVKDKETEPKITQKKDMEHIKEQLKITRTYQEALSLFLDPGREAPHRIPHSQNVCESAQGSSSIDMKVEADQMEEQENT